MSLGYLLEHQAMLDQKIERAEPENDELVPSFNFKVYQIDINRRMKKRMAKNFGKRIDRDGVKICTPVKELEACCQSREQLPLLLGDSNVINQQLAPTHYMEMKHKRRRARTPKVIKNCIHTDLAHYAKGMCKKCYCLNGREARATACEHSDRMCYARGLCHNCYCNWYNQQYRNKGMFIKKNVQKV